MPPPRMVRKLIILSFLLKSGLVSANTFIPDSRVIRDEWIKFESNSTDYQDYLWDFFSVQENLPSSDDEITEQATELNHNGRFMVVYGATLRVTPQEQPMLFLATLGETGLSNDIFFKLSLGAV
jgi:hypothetical protein